MIELLISTFCRIDDFCIIYEKQLKLKQIGMDRNRKYGKAQQLAVSEIMTIFIMFQITQSQFQNILQRVYQSLLA